MGLSTALITAVSCAIMKGNAAIATNSAIILRARAAARAAAREAGGEALDLPAPTAEESALLEDPEA